MAISAQSVEAHVNRIDERWVYDSSLASIRCTKNSLMRVQAGDRRALHSKPGARHLSPVGLQVEARRDEKAA